MCTCLCQVIFRSQRRISDTVELELTGRCELPKMDLGNWTLALWKSKLWSYSWVSQPAPVVVLTGSICVYVSECLCIPQCACGSQRGTPESSQFSSCHYSLPSKNQTRVLRPDLQVLLPIPMAHLASTRSDYFILANQ